MTNLSIRSLFITKEVPYPTVGGVSLRTWQNINIMNKLGEVAVFSASNWNPKEKSLPGVTLWHHCNVTTDLSFSEKLERRLWWLRKQGHSDADWPYSQTAAQQLKQVLADFQPNVVIFEEVWLYRYLPIVKNYPCRIILDNLNIEASLFAQNSSSAQSFKLKLKAKIQLSQIQSIEGEFSRKVDQVWVCSNDDAKLLKQLYGQVAATHVIPNSLNISFYDCVRSGECSPPSELEKKQYNLMFLGQLSYPPNTVAAELLLTKIYPKIKLIYPNSRLLLVGRNPNQFMQEAAKSDTSIIVTGSVADTRPYLAAASVLVVPLLQGGGTRLKILEAFAAGCPVISTDKGAEGLKAIDGEHLLIRNTPEEIVEGVRELWSNPSLGKKLIDSAYKLVQAEYSWQAVSSKVNSAIQEII